MRSTNGVRVLEPDLTGVVSEYPSFAQNWVRRYESNQDQFPPTGLLASVADRQPTTPRVQPAEFLPSMEQQFSSFLRALRLCGVFLALHDCVTLTSNPVRHRLKPQ